jgi:hypothetical protein
MSLRQPGYAPSGTESDAHVEEIPVDATESERLPASELDDDRNREELRRRYDMLLEELKVLLPGVQVLVAFLLTAPFAQGFARVDGVGRAIYAVALTAGMLAILALMTPITLHRFGPRTARSERLSSSIGATRVGIALLGVSLLCAFSVVVRLMYSSVAAAVMIGFIAVATVVSWLVVPRHLRHRRRSASDDPGRP